MKSLFINMGIVFALCSVQAVQAHSPFVAPQSYLVSGNSTTLVAGFAEYPFDSELALSDFKFSALNPNGQKLTLAAQGTKHLSVADIETKANGTYKIQANRDNTLNFAKVKDRWIRVSESHSQTLAPLSERQFITPAEVTDKMAKASTVRHETLISYFSKQIMSHTVLKKNRKGLDAEFSVHPNALSSKQAVQLTLMLNGSKVGGYSVKLSKQSSRVDEKIWQKEMVTNGKGLVELRFPEAGQYFVEINSPKNQDSKKPKSHAYRLNISLQVD